MHVQTAAIFALAVLSVQGLTNKVNATENSQFPPPISEADNFIVEPSNAIAQDAVVSQPTSATQQVSPLAAASVIAANYSTTLKEDRDPQQYIVEPNWESVPPTRNPIDTPLESPIAARSEAVAVNFDTARAARTRGISPLDAELNQPLALAPPAAHSVDPQSYIVDPLESVDTKSKEHLIAKEASVTSDVAEPVLPPETQELAAQGAVADARRAELMKAVAIAYNIPTTAPLIVVPSPPPGTSVASNLTPPTYPARSPASLLLAASSGQNAAGHIVEPQATAVSQLPSNPGPIVPPPPPAQDLPPATVPVVPPAQTVPPIANPIPTSRTPSLEEIRNLRNQLRGVEDKIADLDDYHRASPSLTIVTPSGYGAHNNTAYVAASFQSRTRYADTADGGLVFGVGLGNARKNVGVDLSYTVASFGGSRDFGAGGFNIKLHRQFSEDFSVAAGWNGIINTGGYNDFKNSIYASATKIIRLQDDIKKPFSRVAVSAGIGSGRFRSEGDFENDRSTVKPFGSIAVRVAEPVSAIVEWTGQDLALGASIVPFKNVPLVITPGVRDITGAGDGARFVLGIGYTFSLK